MVSVVVSLFLLSSLSNGHGQTTITFRLNAQPLIDRGLFSPERGEKLLVRGDFNQWTENTCELKGTDADGVYSRSLTIHVDNGDTLEYKFVLQNSEGHIIWEKEPNPENENYGNRQFVVAESNVTLPMATFDYDEYIRYPIIFGKCELQEDFMQMRDILESNHPALHDYVSEERLNSRFEHHFDQIDRDLSFGEFYRILTPVLSSIGCGHTKLWIPSDYWNIVPSKLFPLRILLTNSRVLVGGWYSLSSSIPLGSEILSINNAPVKEIIATLKSVTSSDGFIQAFKSRIVEKHFSKRYALFYGYPDVFSVRYIAPDEPAAKGIELLPVGVEAIDADPVRGSELSLRFLGGTADAILTINTFIYYDQLEMFRSFIDSTFEAIHEKGVDNLIIDLRGNDGGDPFCASYLLSYIAHTAVPYFAESYGKYAALAEPIALAERSFRGNLYMLIDGGIFSTTGHLCSLLKYHKIGTFVGTETGSTFTCTGNVRYINLKNTRLILGTARKQRYSAAVQNMDRTRGILPDYRVEQSQHDLMEGKDTILDFALDLIDSDDRE
jgi:hypothetical protein